MAVQENVSDSLVWRYSMSSFFCAKRGSRWSTAWSWLLAEYSDGMNRRTPACTAASTRFFCSPKPPAPRVETTTSWPTKALCRSSAEKSLLWTATPAGNVAWLSVRETTVTVN